MICSIATVVMHILAPRFVCRGASKWSHRGCCAASGVSSRREATIQECLTRLADCMISKKDKLVNSVPLVVDLDGTLIYSDMLHESALKLLGGRPLAVVSIPLWLMRGKAWLKQRLATDFNPAADSLPYNLPFLNWLRAQQAAGRRLVLCTASDQKIAREIAGNLGIFDEVMASDGQTNLAGTHKASALIERFGKHGFDYAGNAKTDLAVWRSARRAIVVNASSQLASQAQMVCEVEHHMPSDHPVYAAWWKALRSHQWLKNSLLFVPMVAAHQLAAEGLWVQLALAFVAFSLCASSVYILNDLTDLESDRQHPRKRLRPFASGVLPVWKGVALVPLLLLAATGLALAVGKAFGGWLALYFVVTCCYSWGLKRLTLVDCLTLAMLYTLRIVAGAAAAGLALSFWLLAFSVFLFMSLAFVKRYAELSLSGGAGSDRIPGRGYVPADAPLVQTMGISSGYAAVLVLALYLNSEAVLKLYHSPELIWGAVPVMLFWVSWVWMQAHRGRMHDDPLVFAVKDPASWFAGLSFGLFLVLGKMSWSWLR